MLGDRTSAALPSCAAPSSAPQSMPGRLLARSRRASTDCCAVGDSPRSARASRAPWRSWSRGRRSAAPRACGVGQAGELQDLGDIRRDSCRGCFAIVRRRPTDNSRGPAGRGRPASDRALSRRVVEPLGDEDAEQVFGLEIGRVERIGVGAEGAADRLRQRALVGDAVDRVEVGLGRRQCRAGRSRRC